MRRTAEKCDFRMASVGFEFDARQAPQQRLSKKIEFRRSFRTIIIKGFFPNKNGLFDFIL